MNRLGKLLAIAARPSLLPALLRGTAAGVEHIEALRHLDVATCIDVGANVGQFSLIVRYLFPKAEIVAFEPLTEAADKYEDLFQTDAAVTLHRVALGAASGRGTLHVTDRMDSSSLLAPAEGQRLAFGVQEAETRTVPVHDLREMMTWEQCRRPIVLKIDVQGSECDVLAGCGDALGRIDAVYLEASFVELYAGQALAGDVVRLLAERGFALRGVFNVARTQAFGATQADLLFCRKAGQGGACAS